ncbi:uncharacterized protein E2C01_004648 [Portunus trituberculatus]|uniref:Major facilitator superfamily domain-containing protein 7 n=1 Tax=Portunus trituberculatus TaxID=210409 RepID=A0A5B7CR95_PORTR|nr:uncharacterized protein [Portunus trituberculatus]
MLYHRVITDFYLTLVPGCQPGHSLPTANPLGILVTQVVSPLIVTEKENIPTLNYVFGGLAIFSLLTTLVCVTRSMPPTPPSHSAARGERDRAPYLQQLKETFTSVPYLLLLLALGCGIALFSSLATVTQQILCPLGYNDLFSGVAMAVMILCGFVGSAVTGVAADRTKAFTPITKLFYGCAAIFAIFMMEMFLVPGQPTLVAIACGLFGFFGVGVYPIGLELAVETTFPVEESISTAFIFMSGQAQGVIIIGMVTLLSRDQLAKYSHLEVCTGGESSDLRPRDYSVSLMAIMGLLSFMVILVIIFFNTPYKRLEAEKASTSNISSSSSNQSLTATSGYGSECVSRNTTTSSRVSRHRPTVLPEDVNETPEVPPLGISVAQVVAPIVVTKKQQIPTLNYIYGGLALLAEIATLICVTRWVEATNTTESQRRTGNHGQSSLPAAAQADFYFSSLPWPPHNDRSIDGFLPLPHYTLAANAVFQGIQ